jgi:hypothetical protein
MENKLHCSYFARLGQKRIIELLSIKDFKNTKGYTHGAKCKLKVMEQVSHT